ncbi:hypothetical protein T439DRAFT_198485 [Meredithblackwellia eburnea MCA 4105]
MVQHGIVFIQWTLSEHASVRQISSCSEANGLWEIGTHAQAITEYIYPTLSPFSAGSIPIPTSPIAYQVLTIANYVLSTKQNGTLPLMQDGSSADPASTGVAVLLANETSTGLGYNVTPAAYGQAATDQVTALLQFTPRSPQGAISHRNSGVELWSDFVYMVPPFFAYYGVLFKNTTVIQAAYDQCRLYRDALRTSTGLWEHIVGGSTPDAGSWATGNGWAAAGMLRVYATIQRSSYASQYSSQLDDLINWTSEIVTAAFALQQPKDYLFPNYFDSNVTTFSDAASSALISSVYYRLLFLGKNSSTLPTLSKVEHTRLAVFNAVSQTTGVLSPVVDPLSYMKQGTTTSPEGQAFVLILEASWRDWYEGVYGPGTVNESTPAAKSAAVKGVDVARSTLVTCALAFGVAGLALFL